LRARLEPTQVDLIRPHQKNTEKHHYQAEMFLSKILVSKPGGHVYRIIRILALPEAARLCVEVVNRDKLAILITPSKKVLG
jgi:hypothetical protein